MVRARQLGPGARGAGHQRREVGQQVGPGGRADLVVDHVQFGLRGRQAQHRLGEVAAARGVDPAGAQDQVPAAALADLPLAIELGAPVDRQRAGGRVFGARLVAAAVEDVVGAVVHQPGAGRRGAAREHAGRVGVDRLGEVGLRFRLVDGRVGGGVDDQVGTDGLHRGRERGGLREVGREVAALEVERQHLAQRLQRALQFPADLAVASEQEDLHVSSSRIGC